MSQWYCYIGGQRYGPVEQATLQQWVAEGRLKPSDQVWAEGMAQWVPAGSIEGLCPQGMSMPVPYEALVSYRPAGGTYGQTPNRELTAKARELLSGNWGLAVGFSLLLTLLSLAAGMLPYIGAVIGQIVAGPFTMGGIIFYLTLSRRGQCDLGMLFRGFKDFGRTLGAHLLVLLFILLWSLLAIIPIATVFFLFARFGRTTDPLLAAVMGVVGATIIVASIIPAIIAALSYSQTFYLLADDLTLGSLEAIRQSKRMMKGYKEKLAYLMLRFVGWWLLCYLGGVLTCGIGIVVGILFLVPYMSTTYAQFYEDLLPPAGV